MHLVDGLSGLLAVVEDSEDDAAVLTGGCRWVCRQAGALAVAVVSADGASLVAAEGWRRADLAGEIAAILSGPARDARQPDHDTAASSFGVSVRYGGVTIGFVVARGRVADRPALQQAAHAFAALGGSALRARLDALTVSQRAHAAVPEIVGDSPLIAAVRDAVTRAAAAPFPVLIEGESGTGKELVARALHRLGPRRDHRLSAVNCAALNDELVEAELFGHARGAFTGAVGPRTGLFEEAHRGTLFLDEVTELSPRAQAKLLRVLQEREVRRVGENVPRAIDVRVIAACNVPLADAVAGGRFRDDLRFRLAVVRIRLPALRERLEDLPALARLFWRRAAAEAGTRATLGPDALVRLTRHAWPGNVRELQNVVAGLVVAAPARGRVTGRHVDQVLSHVTTTGESPGVPLDAARRTFERRVIAAALVRHAGRRTAAACELGLTRQGLTKALRRLGLAAEEDAAGVA
jgi:DNA-binding NtrC family response regulator